MVGGEGVIYVAIETGIVLKVMNLLLLRDLERTTLHPGEFLRVTSHLQ